MQSGSINCATANNQLEGENGWRGGIKLTVPRKRESWETTRARQLDQEARDRRQREAVLAQLATPTPTPASDPPPGPSEAPPEEAVEPPGFDFDAYQRNSRITALMASRFGPNWATNRSHHRLAERALADLSGNGDGKALRNLRNTTGNGTYTAALDFKFGPL